MKKLIKQIKKFFTPTKWYRVYATKCSMYKSNIFCGAHKIKGVAVFITNEDETKVKAYLTDGETKQYVDPFVLYNLINRPDALDGYYDLIAFPQ